MASNIDKLKRYEWASLGSSMSQDKNRGALAIGAMEKQYFDVFGNDSGDPILKQALVDASLGLEHGGGVSNAGVLKAMGLYTEKFMKALKTSTVGEFVSYAGYTNIPVEVQTLLDNYSSIKIGDLAQGEISDELKVEHNNVIEAIDLLRRQHFEAGLYPTLVTENTKKGLESLVETA